MNKIIIQYSDAWGLGMWNYNFQKFRNFNIKFIEAELLHNMPVILLPPTVHWVAETSAGN